MSTNEEIIGCITVEGVLIPYGKIAKRFGNMFQDFLQKLTKKHEQRKGPPKYCKLYKYKEVTIAGNKKLFLQLTKHTAQVLLGTGILTSIVARMPPIKPLSRPVILRGTLFPQQQAVVDYLATGPLSRERIEAGMAGCTLNMPPGDGKTFTAAGLIHRLGLRTLYITPRIPLAVQAVKDLNTMLGMAANGNNGNGNNGSGTTDVNIIANYSDLHGTKRAHLIDTADIVVMVLDSAMLQTTEYFAKFSFIIVDEVHMCCSEKRRELFWKCQMRCMLAMSGTTNDRVDGFDFVYTRHFGDVVYATEIARNAGAVAGTIAGPIAAPARPTQFRGVVHVIEYYGPDEYTKNLKHEKTGELFTPYIIEQFLSDPYRNQLLLEELQRLYDWRGPNGEKHGIFVFGETRAGLENLTKKFSGDAANIDGMINKQDMDNNDVGDIIAAGTTVNTTVSTTVNTTAVNTAVNTTNITTFYGGMKESEINEAIKCRILCSTYGYASTGVSLPWMSAIILQTPRKTGYIQTCGRILRKGGNLNVVREIIDIVDMRTIMKHQYKKRLLAYQHYGFDIQTRRVFAKNMTIGHVADELVDNEDFIDGDEEYDDIADGEYVDDDNDNIETLHNQ